MLKSVELSTGRPVELRAEPALAGRARGAYIVSDPDRSRHLIVYDPAKSDLLDHIVAHEIGHLEMYASARSDERIVAVLSESGRRRARAAIEKEVTELGLDRNSSAVAWAVDAWIDGVARQVSSFPADLLIERRIWELHPSLRSRQRAALETTATESHQAMEARVRDVTPPTVFLASNAMNYALLDVASRFLGAPWMLRPYRRGPIQSQGKALLESFFQRGGDDLVSLSRVSKEWARQLGISDWLDWRPVDDLGGASSLNTGD
ncbi:MAG: hypothetical protein KC482_01350 [Dehalococcoidia bacterium]|nr:hypothetical protein [Dehalococcoidia bacterium]